MEPQALEEEEGEEKEKEERNSIPGAPPLGARGGEEGRDWGDSSRHEVPSALALLPSLWGSGTGHVPGKIGVPWRTS